MNHDRSQGLKDFKALNLGMESQGERNPKDALLML